MGGAAARRAVRLAQATAAYSIIEGVVAVTAGLAAGSVALVGFGFDSAIEVAAAAVVLWRLRADTRGGEVDEPRQRLALRFIAMTFFVLAAYVIVEGVRDLMTGTRPDTSPVSIALTGLSIVIMPLLAWAKRRAGQAMNSRLVIADAAETKLCAWLSVSTFVGLVARGSECSSALGPSAVVSAKRVRSLVVHRVGGLARSAGGTADR